MVEKDNIGQTRDQEEETAQTETKREKDGAAATFGKFKSPDALYAAYIELEADYTKKCQRLKELEKRAKASEQAEQMTEKDANAGPSQEDNPKTQVFANEVGEKEREIASDKADEERIIQRYLASVAAKKIPLMGCGGAIVTSEKKKPRSVREAGGLALQYFKGNDGNR